MLLRRWIFRFLFALLVAAVGRPACAGTTGTLVGRVVTGPAAGGLAGVRITVVAPSQSAQTVSDANGSFRFISLVPDTYVLSAERQGYETLTQRGITVASDQTVQSPLVQLQRAGALAVIGRTRATGAENLVRAGTTSDVYSVNAAGAEAAQALGGPGGLNSAYSAIASVPGVNLQQGQQGWFQTVNIRGGDIDQVGYELDGIPVNRVYDNAPQSVLSNIGQQELQVYTGGTPASADAPGIAGYINQVIRQGTYPGFFDVNGGIGGPQFYHKLSVEFGGATKDRLFSYYVGLAGVNQSYRYLDNFNGVSDPQFFYPVSWPGRFNIYDGTPAADGSSGIHLAPGSTYALAQTIDRENVVNLHVGIPHHGGALKDDVQLLYLTSRILAPYYGSIDDQGGVANVAAVTGGNAFYHDGFVYNGPQFAPVDAGRITPYLFPSSPTSRAFDAPASDEARDTTDNGIAVEKLQYQRNFGAKSYARIYAYSVYSNWFIYGAANQNFTNGFGAELNDYEIGSHTSGLNFNYANQLSDKHLLTGTASYNTTQLQRRYSYSFPSSTVGQPFTNLVDAKGNCYDPNSGAVASCFDSSLRGSIALTPAGTVDPASGTLPIAAAAQTAFAAAGVAPQWIATDNLYRNSPLNNVAPAFTAVSLTDQWRPSDRLQINAGLRIESYDDRLADTTASPSRAFWFAAYNNEYCFKPGAPSPVQYGPGASTANCVAQFGPGFQQADLVDQQQTRVSTSRWQPRLGFTYSVDPDTVLRGSFGVYARAVNTSWLQYNTIQQDLASFIGTNFLTLGYNTPVHALKPDTSYNADFSLEKHLRGTDFSFKLTPFYRATRDQLQPVPIGVGGVVTGFNVGRQTSDGVELALRKGDFARDGLSAQVSYTYTHSRIRYQDFPSGTNVIDGLNQYIQEYNSYTSACAKITPANTQSCGGTSANAQATFASADGTAQVRNPYYAQAPQPLLDRNGSFTTYDQIPQVFTGENGYETPHVASLILNYRHAKFTVTPSLTFSSGAFYGSPLAYPGYVPTGCSVSASDPAAADPKSCTGASAVSGLPFLITPDAFTGRFDTLGAFQQPSRLTLNFASSFSPTPRLKITGIVTGLVDRCFQRGYAWDDKNICVYSQLPSGGAGLGPSGNFLPIAQTPIAFRYPYGVFNNNLNTGFVGTVQPLQFTANLEVRL